MPEGREGRPIDQSDDRRGIDESECGDRTEKRRRDGGDDPECILVCRRARPGHSDHRESVAVRGEEETRSVFVEARSGEARSGVFVEALSVFVRRAVSGPEPFDRGRTKPRRHQARDWPRRADDARRRRGEAVARRDDDFAPRRIEGDALRGRHASRDPGVEDAVVTVDVDRRHDASSSRIQHFRLAVPDDSLVRRDDAPPRARHLREPLPLGPSTQNPEPPLLVTGDQ
mmetsp:Transcript_3177/g.10522  ORF Transcript_3177/g.10522 Transcript_3177/m.10522 type:complete len:229 (+) Transcript_3177:520-1206(+)